MKKYEKNMEFFYTLAKSWLPLGSYFKKNFIVIIPQKPVVKPQSWVNGNQSCRPLNFLSVGAHTLNCNRAERRPQEQSAFEKTSLISPIKSKFFKIDFRLLISFPGSGSKSTNRPYKNINFNLLKSQFNELFKFFITW
jgi:hypothetical protein